MPRPRLVVLDLDDTLVDHRGAATAGFETWVRRYGVVADDALVATWLAIEERRFRAWTREGGSFTQLRRDRLRDFLAVLDEPAGDDEELDEVFAEFLVAYRASWRAFDDVVPALEVLRAEGYATAVLTNGVQVQQEAKLRHTGLTDLLGPVHAADTLGVAKPAAGAFHAVCAAAGVAPSAAVNVGDVLDIDVLGARAAGLGGVHVLRPGAVAPADGDHATISTLADLPAVLAGG